MIADTGLLTAQLTKQSIGKINIGVVESQLLRLSAELLIKRIKLPVFAGYGFKIAFA
jgi:hypothetical protein